MGAVAVLLETSGAQVRSTSLPAVTAARQLAQHHGGGVVGVVLGAGVADAAQDAGRYVDRVLRVDAPALGAALAETWAPALVAAVKKAGATALVASATSTGKDVLPRAAALLDAGMASDILAVTGAKTFRRPTYAGNALTDVEVATDVVVASVRQTEFAAAAAAATAGAVESFDPGALDALGAEFVALHATKSTRPELTEAQVVVSGGRGTGSAEGFHVIEDLADALGAAVGASRAVVDNGWRPHSEQVGQTGKTVAPNLYIALGISGAIQHLAGMRTSKVIVAINKDPDAPIFKSATYGIVGDVLEIVPALTQQLKKVLAT